MNGKKYGGLKIIIFRLNSFYAAKAYLHGEVPSGIISKVEIALKLGLFPPGARVSRGCRGHMSIGSWNKCGRVNKVTFLKVIEMTN